MKSSRTYSRITRSLLGVMFLLAYPLVVSADGPASFSITPATGSYGVGKTFTVQITADSPSGFNSANAILGFDPTLLSVSTVSKNNSAFSLWAVDPSFDNNKGSISFEGGNTTALSGSKTILAVTFRALKVGSAQVSFTSGSILAADGKGTDILGTKNSSTFEISTAGGGDTPPPAPAPTPPPTATGPKPDIPEITSLTHPSDSAYANAVTAKFSWELPYDVTVARMVLDTKDNTVPTTNYDPAIAEKEFEKLTDGIMYFHLRYLNDAGWGPTLHRKIMVDQTPPEKFDLVASVEASSTDAVLKFNATDTLSGIDRYEAIVDGGTPIKIPLSILISGAFTLAAQPSGEHVVKITAYDKAGNSTGAEAKFTIDVVPILATAVGDDTPQPTDWRLIGDIILVALIAFLIGYLWYERSAFRHEKYLAKREADELRDNMGNVFSAVREEIGEQAGRLFQKPNPSAQDREVMVNINEAVDLSEELLSKEVEDVRKLLS